MAVYTVNQISSLVNEAFAQATGKTDITQLDTSVLSDVGITTLLDIREQFTNALINVCTKNWFTDTSYRSEYVDIFFEDFNRFGAIIQSISVEAPEVIDNPAWAQLTTGTSTVGNYTIYLPVVDTEYYTKSSAWSLPITISWEQWDTSFRNLEEINGFVEYVMMIVDNALVQHMEDMNMSNRNNFISEKIIYSKNPEARGTHVIDLVAKYCEQNNITTTTSRDSLLNNRDFLVFAAAEMDKVLSYFRKQTCLFNTSGKLRFTPEDRLCCQILTEFETKLSTIGYATTFHDDYIKLPLHESVPWWQSPGDLSFDDISSIHVESNSGTTETSGIVGLIADKWSIVHTIRSNRVASKYFDIENLTLYDYQHRDSYINNLSMNAVVFVMNDYVVE